MGSALILSSEKVFLYFPCMVLFSVLGQEYLFLRTALLFLDLNCIHFPSTSISELQEDTCCALFQHLFYLLFI